MSANKCHQCDGEGFTGSDDEHAPWSFWASLPPGSDFAVRLGLVTKVPCSACTVITPESPTTPEATQ